MPLSPRIAIMPPFHAPWRVMPMPTPRWPLPFTAAFRLFFPLAAIATLAIMLRTVAILHGGDAPAGNPFTWHGHEMLFGYVAAAVAGFVLTAVPNWTGTQPVSGLPLALLFILWLMARIGLWSGDPAGWAIAADIAFLPAAALVASRPLWSQGKARQWLPVGVIITLGLANALWHLGPVINAPALPSRALTFTTLLVTTLIAVIGGRIIPAFTRNRLRTLGATAEPRAMDLRDSLAIGASAATALAELGAPALVAWLALTAGLLHAIRLYGWRGLRTWRDPLLFILHIGYGWLALGYLILGFGMLSAGWSDTWALHGLLTGAIGTMTLAVMTRATFGHTGRPLQAGIVMTTAFVAIQGAIVIRLLGPVVGPHAWHIAGVLWSTAFLLFLLRCGPMFLRPRINA
ncbi:MAG: NnrS family protein [Halofilum sp. (in: g-proteobacteria)]